MNMPAFSAPKPFQVETAKAALKAFESGRKRFLIADEVGLGKTVVARTIIAEMMEGKRSPLVVFYVASNLNIAFQNRRKLLEVIPIEEREQAEAAADRLTIAAGPANRPTHPHLHLYTLTPDTSVPLLKRHGGLGRMEERALVYRLLAWRFPTLDTSDFRKLCRGRAGEGRWREVVRDLENMKGTRRLQDGFIEKLVNDTFFSKSEAVGESLIAVMEEQKASRIMGRLRNDLALATLSEIRPDLIIFDEFQNFRKLLIDEEKNGRRQDPDPVTQGLRGKWRDSDPAVLLLSATPYRLYSSRLEEAQGKSHHQEFFELIEFLFRPGSKSPEKIREALGEFGKAILSPAPDFKRLEQLREEIQEMLRPVMSRTERHRPDVAHRESKPPRLSADLATEDLQLFKHWVARLKDGANRKGRRHANLTSFAVPYWLSIPLPIQFSSRDYVAWKYANKDPRRNEPRFRGRDRDRLRPLSPWPHPQLRSLNAKLAARNLALPWVAPSLPWWELGGIWSASPGEAKPVNNHEGTQGGKMLIFSRFRAVPPALASLMSFGMEAEWAHRLGHSYRRAGEAQPLQFKADRLPLLALFFPSPTLILHTDPRRQCPLSLREVRLSMNTQVRELMRKFGVSVRRSGRSKPLWKLVAGLECKRQVCEPESGLPDWDEVEQLWHRAAGGAPGQSSLMRDALEKWREATAIELKEVTETEIATLAEFALAGPGVVVGRVLHRFNPACVTGDGFGAILQASWNGLRLYLNNAWFKAALTRRGRFYTDSILEAVVAGNLESVLDEHLWIMSQLDADAVPDFCTNLKKVLGLRAGRHQVFEPGKQDGFTLRCHAAVPFADAKVEDGTQGGEQRVRTDELRRAFNTPFWPHVLTTTSLGQEGLDFHVWCRQLLHWDLCHSPLDLEQREGRIQRFGGLSIRVALANHLKQQALAKAAGSQSPWCVLAEMAEQGYSKDSSGLKPWWVCEDERLDRLVKRNR